MARERTEIEIAVVDGATKALNSIAKSTASGKTAFTELNSAIGLVEKGLGALSSIGSFAVDLIQPARDVQTALAAVQAVTGATAEEFASLKKAAQDAGTSTKFSTAEAAGGLAELARAGFTATQAIDALNPALNLAQGNSIQVSEAATILTTALVQFGLASDQAVRASDILQKTADATATSVTEVGNAMSYAAPPAKALGFSIEETAAAIGILANNGLRGERAGTVLRDVFTQLLLPTSQLSKLMAEAGVETTTFSGFLQALGKDTELANKAFAILGVSGAGLRPIVEDAGKSVSEFTTVLQGAAGTAQATADVMGATFDSAITRILNALTTLSAEFFNPILAPFVAEIDVVSAKIRELAGTDDFKRLQAEVVNFVNNAIEKVKELTAGFDFTSAIESIRRFVAASTVAFSALATGLSGARIEFNKFLVILNGIELALSKTIQYTAELALLQLRAAEYVGLATDASREYALILEDVARSAEREAEVNKNDLFDSLNIVLNGASGAAGAVNQLADAHDKAATAAKSQAESSSLFSGIKGIFENLKESVAGLAPTLTAGTEAFGKFGERSVTAVGKPGKAIEELRARIATLNAALNKAFAAGLPTDAIVNDLRIAQDELDKLTGAAKPAGEAVKKVGDEAQTAAPKVQALANSSGSAATKAKELAKSSDDSAGSLFNLTGAAQQTGYTIDGVSEKFGQMLQQIQQSGAGANLAITEGLNAALDAQRQQVGLALRGLDDYDAAVESRLKQLRNRYDLIDDEILRKLAEKQAAADKASAQRAADAPPSVHNSAGAIPGGIGSGAPVFNITLQSLSPGDLSNSTISDLARRLAGPIRTYYQSGA